MRKLLTLLGLIISCIPIDAATINALSGSYSDITNATAQTSPGDIVIVPPGTNSINQNIYLNQITLQFSGTNTSWISNDCGVATALFTMNCSSNHFCRVTGLAKFPGATNFTEAGNNIGVFNWTGSGCGEWIDNCFFYFNNCKGVHPNGQYGAIIDCGIFAGNNTFVVECYDSGYGDNSWTVPNKTGDTNMVWLVNCKIVSFYGDQGYVDAGAGGRLGMINCDCTNFTCQLHGYETSDRYRSAKYLELNGNKFSWGHLTNFQNFAQVVQCRGGSVVMDSNTFIGYNNLMNNSYFAADNQDTGFNPRLGMSGTNHYDLNGPLLLSGTATGTNSGQLWDPTANWSINQWRGCTIVNVNSNVTAEVTNNVPLFGYCYTNSPTVMYFRAARTAQYAAGWKTGDPYTVYYVTNGIDAIGNGYGDLLNPTNYRPTAVWLNQHTEPIYQWSNIWYVVHSNPGGDLQNNTDVGANYTQWPVGTNIINGIMPGYIAPPTNFYAFFTNNVQPTNSVVTTSTGTRWGLRAY